MDLQTNILFTYRRDVCKQPKSMKITDTAVVTPFRGYYSVCILNGAQFVIKTGGHIG